MARSLIKPNPVVSARLYLRNVTHTHLGRALTLSVLGLGKYLQTLASPSGVKSFSQAPPTGINGTWIPLDTRHLDNSSQSLPLINISAPDLSSASL